MTMALKVSVTLFSSDLPKMPMSTDFIELNLNQSNFAPIIALALVTFQILSVSQNMDDSTWKFLQVMHFRSQNDAIVFILVAY